MNNNYLEDLLHDWENEIGHTKLSRLENTYDRLLNQLSKNTESRAEKKVHEGMDNTLFYAQALLQEMSIQKDAKATILETAKVFQTNIQDISDLKKLTIGQRTFIANQQISKQKIYGLMQGALTGSGGLLLVGIDIPALILMNIRVTQLIGMSFGYEVNKPYEMMLSLKVFHTSILPKKYQRGNWDTLISELSHAPSYMYDGKDEITNAHSFYFFVQQIIKHIVILIARKKVVQGIPLFGIAIGAISNYQLIKQTSSFTLRFYQKRYLVESSQF